jgi:hypothetical protein
MSSWYGYRSQAFQASRSSNQQNQKIQKVRPSISKPASTADCNVMIKRMKDTNSENDARLSDLNAQSIELQNKIAALNLELRNVSDEIISVKKTQAQSIIDEKFLMKWAEELKLNDKKNDEVMKWKEYLSKNKISDDTFSFTKINKGNTCSLDMLTHDEIIKIGKYTKASELVRSSDIVRSKMYGTYNTYAELYDACDEEYDHRIIGSVHRCNSNSDDSDSDDSDGCDDCCHKLYAYTLSDFEDVNIDDTSIAIYSRIN